MQSRRPRKRSSIDQIKQEESSDDGTLSIGPPHSASDLPGESGNATVPMQTAAMRHGHSAGKSRQIPIPAYQVTKGPSHRRRDGVPIGLGFQSPPDTPKIYPTPGTNVKAYARQRHSPPFATVNPRETCGGRRQHPDILRKPSMSPPAQQREVQSTIDSPEGERLMGCRSYLDTCFSEDRYDETRQEMRAGLLTQITRYGRIRTHRPQDAASVTKSDESGIGSSQNGAESKGGQVKKKNEDWKRWRRALPTDWTRKGENPTGTSRSE